MLGVGFLGENDVEVIYVQHDAGPGTGFSMGDEAFEIAYWLKKDAQGNGYMQEAIKLIEANTLAL